MYTYMYTNSIKVASSYLSNGNQARKSRDHHLENIPS